MRYQQQPQPQFHESLTATWTDLATVTRDGGYDQIRGLYLHRRSGTDTGSIETRYLDGMADALAASADEDLEVGLERIRDQLRAGAITIDLAGLMGLAISVHDEDDETITIHGVFTDETRHEITASPAGALTARVTNADDADEPNPIAGAMMRVLDTLVGDRHDQVTRALHDALALCLRNGFQAAIGIWEQKPGVYQARPFPDLGQTIVKASQAGATLEAALQRAARDLRSRPQRKPKRPPTGFGWIRHNHEVGPTSSVVGITVLDGWVYVGSLRSGQSKPKWTIFPGAASGDTERELVDALGQVLAALRGRVRP